MILLIDNYDSFTFNLVQYFGDLGAAVDVRRNDDISVDEALEMQPEAFVISPGPSDPDHAGICLDLIGAAMEDNIPLLGVCLGHQCIGQALGGRVVRAPIPMHGKVSNISHTGKSLFSGLPSPLQAARYHSLIVDRGSMPEDLDITAESEDGLVMAVMHREKPLHGVQFHPESIATDQGRAMLKNFMAML